MNPLTSGSTKAPSRARASAGRPAAYTAGASTHHFSPPTRGGFAGSGRPTEDVADAADRVDERRLSGILLDLAPEPVDVDVDRARLAGIVVPPHLLEELVTGEHLSWVP